MSPTNGTSVRKSTVGSSFEARWKLWIADRSWTTIVYVPGARLEIFRPLASFSVMSKLSFVPTIASSTGLSSLRAAPAGRARTASAAARGTTSWARRRICSQAAHAQDSNQLLSPIDDSLPPPSGRRGLPRLRLLAAPRGGAQPPRPRRAEAPSAPARVGAAHARAAGGAQTRAPASPLPLRPRRPRVPRAGAGGRVRVLRGRARRARGPRREDGRARLPAPLLGSRRRARRRAAARPEGARGGPRRRRPAGRRAEARADGLRRPRVAAGQVPLASRRLLGGGVRARVGSAPTAPP